MFVVFINFILKSKFDFLSWNIISCYDSKKQFVVGNLWGDYFFSLYVITFVSFHGEPLLVLGVYYLMFNSFCFFANSLIFLLYFKHVLLCLKFPNFISLDKCKNLFVNEGNMFVLTQFVVKWAWQEIYSGIFSLLHVQSCTLFSLYVITFVSFRT